MKVVFILLFQPLNVVTIRADPKMRKITKQSLETSEMPFLLRLGQGFEEGVFIP